MRDQHTMKDAFKQAQDTVAKWESAQGFEPSEPQWVMGKNMELMLPQLEQHLFPQQNLPQTTTAAKHEDKKHANVTKKSLL